MDGGAHLGGKTVVEVGKILFQWLPVPRPARPQIDQPGIGLIITRAIQFADQPVVALIDFLRRHAFIAGAPDRYRGMVAKTLDGVRHVRQKQLVVDGGASPALNAKIAEDIGFAARFYKGISVLLSNRLRDADNGADNGEPICATVRRTTIRMNSQRAKWPHWLSGSTISDRRLQSQRSAKGA